MGRTSQTVWNSYLVWNISNLKVGPSTSKKKICLLQWKSVKNDEKYLFHLKSSFFSQDI